MAPYPEEVCSLAQIWVLVISLSPQLPFRDEALDRRLKLMQEVVRTIRSMRQDYLPPKARPEGEEVSRKVLPFVFGMGHHIY